MVENKFNNNKILTSLKYQKQFLDLDKSNKDLKSVMDTIIKTERELDLECFDWGTEHIEKFLKDLNSISPNTLSRAFTFLKNFVNYICKREGLPTPDLKLEHGRLHDMVNYDKLLSTVISSQQYNFIKRQLDKNVRDKVMFELAWEAGLSSDDIRNLKEKDIEFISTQEGFEVAILKIGTRKIKIEDLETIRDIKDCIKERYYYSDSKDGRMKRYEYRTSEYLIKPVNVGKSKSEDYLSNPSLALQKAILQQDITCPDISIEDLNIENIKRSKVIFMLAPQNEKYFDADYIKVILDAGKIDSSLYWLKKIAQMKYGEN